MEKIVFTNGCFDLLHPGHIDLLKRAKELGTKLIVGINSDSSVSAIKGRNRPFINENDRAEILRNLKFVDEVVVFDETTPENIIKKIKPDVLVKGGDWEKSQIIGANFVEENGGTVYSIPLKEGFSSSRIVEKIQQEKNMSDDNKSSKVNDLTAIIGNSLEAHIRIFKILLSQDIQKIERCAELIFETFERGNKILICGNGGSAADAQHIAAEFVGRYETERKALPAIALTTDTSALTALANDYDFAKVFARQVEALGAENDLLIAISTSGNSPNVNEAVMSARNLKIKTLGLTGEKGKKLASLCDQCFLVPASRTARIQEAHITIAHIWCEIIDVKIGQNG